MLDIGNGRVLKTVQNPPRGTCELNFYQKVFDVTCKDDDILAFRKFMPGFHGTVVKDGGKSSTGACAISQTNSMQNKRVATKVQSITTFLTSD